MMKLLIVDDEKSVRDDVRSALDWNIYGYEICGEAADGIEALKIAEQYKPDLVITDIRMPGLNGLQITEELKARSPECKIIILTGYSEFQYAKQSIALGVESYLLKPVDEDELASQIKKISDEFTREKTLKDYLNDSRTISSEKIISNLISGQFNDEIIMKANQMCKLDLPWKSYQVLLIDNSDNSKLDRDKRNLLKSELTQFASENNYGHIFESDGLIGILSRNVNFDDNLKPLEYLRRRLEERLGIDALIVIGSSTDFIDEINLSYERAYNLMKNKFIWGSQKIVGYKKDIVQFFYNKTEGTEEGLAEKLYMAVDLNYKQSIKDLLHELGNLFLSRNPDETVIKSSFVNVYYEIVNKLLHNNENIANIKANNDIYSRKNLNELEGYVENKLCFISDELSRLRPDTPLKRIIDYIQRNYAQDIKIENLANIFGYNSIYLGQLFKNHTGKYFNSYLEQVRIEKAKTLLKEGLKVYQVAKQTGYHNLDYFTSKFKKHTGVSPSEYKGEN